MSTTEEATDPIPAPFRDDPIGMADEDELGRSTFADRVVALLGQVADDTPSAVLSLQAPWGDGKTSLMNMIRGPLDEGGWAVVEFNPWEVSSLDALIREFIATLRSALPPSSNGTRAKEALSKYAKRVAPFSSLLGVAGLDPSKALAALGEALESDTSLATVRAELIAALEQFDAQALVLIDDLDRLQGDELTLVLKLVRLVGRLPNVYYLLAFDEATVLDVLSSTPLGNGDRARSLAYLEKIVQVRLDVPPAHPRHLGRMIDSGFEKLFNDLQIVVDEAEENRLRRVYAEHLVNLREVRQVRRFFAQLHAYVPLVINEVDLTDFVLVTYVRTKFPSLYRSLPSRKDALTGSELRISRPSRDEAASRWTDLVGDNTSAAEEARTEALAALSALFGQVATDLGKGTVYDTSARTLQKRVGSSEYFDRYFYLAVPPDDISDVEVREILEEMVGGGGPLTDAMFDRLRDIAEPAIDKLRRFSPSGAGERRALLASAARMVAVVPEVGFFGRSRIVADAWLSELLEGADLGTPGLVVDEICRWTDLPHVVHAFARLERDRSDNAGELTAEEAALKSEIAGRVAERLKDLSADLLGDSSEVQDHIFAWRRVEDELTVRGWLRRQVLEGRWPAEDVASIFVSRQRVIGLTEWHSGGFDTETAEALVGIDFLLEQFDPDPASTPTGAFDGGPDTLEERRRRSQSVLAKIAEERRHRVTVEESTPDEPVDPPS